MTFISANPKRRRAPFSGLRRLLGGKKGQNIFWKIRRFAKTVLCTWTYSKNSHDNVPCSCHEQPVLWPFFIKAMQPEETQLCHSSCMIRKMSDVFAAGVVGSLFVGAGNFIYTAISVFLSDCFRHWSPSNFVFGLSAPPKSCGPVSRSVKLHLFLVLRYLLRIPDQTDLNRTKPSGSNKSSVKAITDLRRAKNCFPVWSLAVSTEVLNG